MSSHVTINGKQVDVGASVAGMNAVTLGASAHNSVADAAKKSSTHRAECGEVGKTGEHGELGTNAA